MFETLYIEKPSHLRDVVNTPRARGAQLAQHLVELFYFAFTTDGHNVDKENETLNMEIR
jgi:hypothetical protein